jgi:hypothetical protein
VKYAHRTHLTPERILAEAARFFGARLGPVAEEPRRLGFAGPVGKVNVVLTTDGGHANIVTVETDQVGESEADKLAKRFLTVLHTAEDPAHRPIGSY